MDQFKAGEAITARVMNINSDERRIGLSIKRLEVEEEQDHIQDFVKNAKPATSSFGELLRDNLEEAAKAEDK
ncbi:MAG: hypothetical protein HQK61_02100 [Desulfamplus sp.]|nr:hypothetical protein [Desulfamplus sp.]